MKKFGEENTDHITNAYLRQMMGRLGVTIPKVVSNVAKKIYCDDAKPENKTIQISNVRSQWAKESNGNDYELQALGDSIKGVRNKVTNLYVERLCDDFEYFKKVNARIDRLDSYVKAQSCVLHRGTIMRAASRHNNACCIEAQ